jgi:hypothetical protein
MNILRVTHTCAAIAAAPFTRGEAESPALSPSVGGRSRRDAQLAARRRA